MKRFRARTLGRRLSLWLALQSLLGLVLVCGAIYAATFYAFKSRQTDDLSQKEHLIAYLASEALKRGDEAKLKHELKDFMVGHPEFGLSVRGAEGAVFFEDLLPVSNAPRREMQFDLVSPVAGKSPLRAELSLDIARDVNLLRRIAAALVLAAAGGVLLISLGGFLLVWLGLRPLRELSVQVKALTPDNLHRRLDGSQQPGELMPLISQFNDLLGRLNASYEQLEGFNADVAHELLTPLATLTSGAELALSSSKDMNDLREAIGSSLEDLQRISGIVHDMLFLSQADRGAVARRVGIDSLSAVARQVADYHDAALADADLRVEVEGDAAGAFDVPLLQRALSNLISNATRYATSGSTVRVLIEDLSSDEVSLQVTNLGNPIDPKVLPRLFDRFFRADLSRSSASRNHGLGLSIVAAIARMHGGRPTASSSGGLTAVGMVLKRFNLHHD